MRIHIITIRKYYKKKTEKEIETFTQYMHNAKCTFHIKFIKHSYNNNNNLKLIFFSKKEEET